MRKTVGAIVVLAVVVILTSFSSAEAWTLNWNAVTTYTDNTPIEASKTVRYDVKMDGTVRATNVTGTSWPFTVADHGVNHVFAAQTVLSTGERSVWSPDWSWTSPLGEPSNPAGFRVAP